MKKHNLVDFVPKLIVKNIKTGEEGVTCTDLPGMMSCNGANEVSVVYKGTTVASGTNYEYLEIIGKEKAVANLKKCGAGKGPDACIFLVMSENGPECERFGNMRWSLIFRKMNAKREPAEPFPECQIF